MVVPIPTEPSDVTRSVPTPRDSIGLKYISLSNLWEEFPLNPASTVNLLSRVSILVVAVCPAPIEPTPTGVVTVALYALNTFNLEPAKSTPRTLTCSWVCPAPICNISFSITRGDLRLPVTGIYVTIPALCFCAVPIPWLKVNTFVETPILYDPFNNVFVVVNPEITTVVPLSNPWGPVWIPKNLPPDPIG